MTSNGSTPGSATVWAVTRADGAGEVHLRAYDAADLTKGNIFDNVAGKFLQGGAFVVPVTVSGKAYVASDYALTTFGILGNTSLIAMGQGNQHLLQVISLASDGLPHLLWQDTNGSWNNFGVLPGTAGVEFATLAAGRGNLGQLQVVGIGKQDGMPYLIWQDPGGNWHNFGQLPNPGVQFVSVALGVGNAGQLQAVFIGKSDGQPYLIWQDTNGGWHSFGKLPNPVGTQYAAIATGNGNLGMLQLMLLGRNDGQPYLIWQDTGGNWHNFGRLPNPNVPFATVAAGVGNSNQLQMIGIGKNDGQPYLIWQDTGGNWHNFGQLPNPNIPFVTLATGNGNQHQLQVICLGKYDGQPYLIWQDTSGGWHSFGKLPNPSQTPPGSAISSVYGSVATGNGNGGMLQVVLLEEGIGRPRLVWQDTLGNWHPYTPAQSLVAFG